MDELIFFFTIAGKNENEFRVFLDGESSGVHEVFEAFLDSKTTDGGDNMITFDFELGEVIVGILIKMIFGSIIIVVEGIIDDADFTERDVVFFVDDTLGGLTDGNNLVGEHEAFVFDFVNQGIAGVHTSAIKFGGVDMSNKGEAIVFFGKDASFKSEPVVGVDDIGLVFHEVLIDEIAVGFLDVANGDIFSFVGGGNDFIEDFGGFVSAAIAVDGVEMGGGEDVHEFDFGVLGFVRYDKIYCGALF